MKKKLQKMSVVVVAMVMFTGLLLLNLEKNEQGKWEVAVINSVAQGGGEHTQQLYHYNLKTITPGFPDFTSGRALIFPNPPSNGAGVASVTTEYDYIRTILYTKTADDSFVVYNGQVYTVAYKATFTTSGVGLSYIQIQDSFQEAW